MIVGPMKKRMFLAGIIGFLIMLLIASVAIVFVYRMYDEQKNEVARLKANKTNAYIFNKDIAVKDEISVSDVELVEIDAKVVPINAYNNLTTINDVFKTKIFARININKGTVFTSDMIYNEEVTEKDVRVQEFNMILLPSDIEEGDYVDVRFLLPTGNDYVVLSRKRVQKVTDRTVWLYLSELDIQFISSAIVETYVTNGCVLYATEYADAPNQEPAEITYAVLPAVRTLISENPNLVESAKTQINNNMAKYDLTRSNINDYIIDYAPIEIEDKIDLLTENVLTRIQLQQEERIKYLEGKTATEVQAVQTTN